MGLQRQVQPGLTRSPRLVLAGATLDGANVRKYCFFIEWARMLAYGGEITTADLTYEAKEARASGWKGRGASVVGGQARLGTVEAVVDGGVRLGQRPEVAFEQVLVLAFGDVSWIVAVPLRNERIGDDVEQVFALIAVQMRLVAPP